MTRLRRGRALFSMLSLLLGLSGCGFSGSSNFSSGGRFGATPGGVQDMGLARALVEEGRVPPPEAFVVEGMFSEHDLPVEGGACGDLLCVAAAGGVAPNLAGDTRAFAQIGLSSTVDPEAYERPSLSVIATVDVSGSMGWRYGSEGGDSPGELSRSLLRRVVAELGEADRVAIVTYGSSVSTALAPTSGANQAAIGAVIDGLRENGSTNMEAGLRRAYELAASELGQADEVRVMLFTDEQPNVGATHASEFQTIVQAGADQGVGITIFGMGLGLGQTLFEAMSHLRGGNAFSVMRQPEVGELMDDSWPWMVSPIAYDLHLTVTPSSSTRVTAGYGFPGAGEDGAARLEVATVFLSRRRGAILVELARHDELPIGQAGAILELGYTRPDGTAAAQTLAVDWSELEPDERGHAYAQPATGRTVALALAVTGMREAAARYATSQAEGAAIAEQVALRLREDAEALGDDALRQEADFAEALLALMRDGAPQGDLYGYGY